MTPAALVLAVLLMVIVGPGMAVAASRAGVPVGAPAAAVGTPGDPVADQAFTLDYDLDRIFRFVADEVRYEPYAGILRGARGTLAARAGNSADKALLLGALLDASQIRYRFARGPIDADTSAALLGTLPADLEAARTIAAQPLLAGLGQESDSGSPATAAAPVVSPAPAGPLRALSVRQGEALAAQAEERFGRAEARLGETVAMLEGALATAGVTLPDAAPALPPAEVDDHTWIQAAIGPEWRDLDATLPAAQPGAVLAPAVETLGRLPDDLRYRVRFDVLVERVSYGELVTGSVLRVEDYADRLGGVPVSFSHVTPSGLRTLGVSISAALGDGWLDYRPSLDLGDRSIVADDAVGFPLDGGGSDILSADPTPSGGPVAPQEGEATAEWLEVEVTPPGAAPTTARRVVFDRVRPNARQAGKPTLASVEPVTLVDLDGSGLPDFAPLLGVESFAIATGPTNVAPAVEPPDDDGLGAFGIAYHALRDVMTADMALDAGARTFIDGPNIVSVTMDIGDGVDPADLGRSLRFGLDIWHRSHGTLPLTGSAIGAGQAEIVAGVTDQLAERTAIEGLADALGTQLPTVGVGEVFEAAAAQDVPIRTLSGAITDPPPMPPGALAAIEAALAAGDVVVIPASPVELGGAQRIGWWQVDPATGATRDVMDDGTGPEMAEQTALAETRLGWVKCRGAQAGYAARMIADAAARYLWANRLESLSIFRSWKYGATRCFAL